MIMRLRLSSREQKRQQVAGRGRTHVFQCTSLVALPVGAAHHITPNPPLRPLSSLLIYELARDLAC